MVDSVELKVSALIPSSTQLDFLTCGIARGLRLFLCYTLNGVNSSISNGDGVFALRMQKHEKEETNVCRKKNTDLKFFCVIAVISGINKNQSRHAHRDTVR